MTPLEQNIAQPAPSDTPTKRCSRCFEFKILSKFKKRPKNTDGLNGVCRACENERIKGKHFPRVPDDTIKNCLKCLLDKMASQFSASHSRPDGLNPWCKICTGDYAKEWIKDPDTRAKVRAGANIRYAKNPEFFREKSRKWGVNHWGYKALQRCKRRAKEKGIPFNLEQADLLNSNGELPEYCAIFPHIKLDYLGGKDRRLWASVDRIVPELGYTKGNVIIISFGANLWKNNGSDPREWKIIMQIINESRKSDSQPSNVDDRQGNLFPL